MCLFNTYFLSLINIYLNIPQDGVDICRQVCIVVFMTNKNKYRMFYLILVFCIAFAAFLLVRCSLVTKDLDPDPKCEMCEALNPDNWNNKPQGP